MRQRVMIAMALACNPQILIADEPTTALDVTIQAQIIDLVKKLRDELGMAVIWITHDLGVVAGLAQRVIVMYAGFIIEEAPVKELYANPMHPYTLGLLESLPRLDRRSAPALDRYPRSAAAAPGTAGGLPVFAALRLCPRALQGKSALGRIRIGSSNWPAGGT